MDFKERDAIGDFHGDLDAKEPRQSVMDENCTACGCRVGDHFARLDGGWTRMLGCETALARKVIQEGK